MVSATRAAKDPDWAFVPLGAVSLSLSEMWHMSKPVKKVLRFSNFWVILEHVQTCDDVRVQSATQSTASVHTWNMSKPVMTFVFKVLRNRLLRYILKTCPNLWWRSCSKCYAIDCFGTYLKHVQTCDDVHVQSATQSTASVHTWNMSKPVMTFMFKVLRNRLLRYILETCPDLWWRSCSKCYAIDCFGTYLKHVQTCDDVHVQSATQSTASVHTWNMSKPVMTFMFKVLRNRLLRYILEACPWARMLRNPVKRCISCT